VDKAYGILMSIIVGICLGIQPTINAALGKVITPKLAAFHSVFVSTIVISIIILFSGNFDEYHNIKNISPLYWLGGVVGIVIVFLGIKVIPILGTASAISIFVSVQLIVGVLINQFGLFGVAKVPIDTIKISGILFLLIGVGMVVR
jgi:bacterial/archaeal transporter family-2 protein